MASRLRPAAPEGTKTPFFVVRQIIRSNSAAKRRLIGRDSSVLTKYGPFKRSSPGASWIKFLCPTKLLLCPQNALFAYFFSLCPDPPHSLPRPPHSLPSPLRSQGHLQLRGSRAVETQWFRWKEIDVLFTIAVTLLPRRTQPMADNYLGRQSRTGGGTIYFTWPFQIPNTRTARGQHGPAARQSRVRIPATD